MSRFNSQAVYIVEDDVPLNNLLTQYLKAQGFSNIHSFFSGEDMIRELPANKHVVIIQDFDLPGINGLEVIKQVKPRFPKADFIFLSGQGSIEIAIESLREGAFDYIVKDSFAKENIITKIRYLLKIRSLERFRKVSQFVLLALFTMLLATWVGLFIRYTR